MNRLALCAILLAGTAACTTVGPDYAGPPETPGAQAPWIAPADTAAVRADWWNLFGDPLLSTLVERALADSPTLAEAEARLAEARANRAEVTGTSLPQVRAGGYSTQTRISENGQFPVNRIPGFTPEFSLFDLGFDASWEVDLWGRRTRAVEATDAGIGAAQAGRDAAMVSLAGEIGRNYVELRQAQAEAALARQTIATQRELARLAELLAAAGETNDIDAANAQAEAEAAAAGLPQAESRARAAAYAIAALLGEPPEALAAQLLEPAAIPAAPEAILIGIRSDLLRRRPDVRGAERELAAATAEVGFTTAELFPSFSLLGGLGTQARSLGDLFDAGSLRYSFGPSFSWPIFSGGRIRARIAAADARADGAAARYEGAVAGALADSETAINRWLSAQAAQIAATDTLASRRRAFDLQQLRFERGEDSRVEMERARLPVIAAERQLASARGATTQAAIALYKALGGAWEADLPD